MYKWKVKLIYGEHIVIADDYSISGGFYIFWIGKTNVRMFPEEEVEWVDNLGRAVTERAR